MKTLAWLLLTPLLATSAHAADLMQVYRDAQDNDAAFAAVSHLPHLLAFAMMQSVIRQENSDYILSLAGTGFRDFTRIAASDPKMWRDILRANREEVLVQSRLFQEALQAFEHAIQADDDQSLEDMLTLASETRAHWRMGALRKHKAA